MKLSEEVIIREWVMVKGKTKDNKVLKHLAESLDHAYENRSKEALETIIQQIKEEKTSIIYKREFDDIYRLYVEKVDLENATHFGNYIKGQRIAAGLTLVALAKASQCSAGYLCRIEKGERKIPGEDLIARLSMALQVPLDVMLREACLRTK